MAKSKYKVTETPNVAQECLVCGNITNRMFSRGKKDSVRACSEKCAEKYFDKRDSQKAENQKAKPSQRQTKPSSKGSRKIAPRRQAIVDIIKKLKNPTMETILKKTPQFSIDKKKDVHATSDTVFRMWKYDGLLKKDGKGKDAKYSFSAKGKKELGIK